MLKEATVFKPEQIRKNVGSSFVDFIGLALYGNAEVIEVDPWAEKKTMVLKRRSYKFIDYGIKFASQVKGKEISHFHPCQTEPVEYLDEVKDNLIWLRLVLTCTHYSFSMRHILKIPFGGLAEKMEEPDKERMREDVKTNKIEPFPFPELPELPGK